MSMYRFSGWLLALAGLITAGCQDPTEGRPAAEATPELAPYMLRLQTHSAKLGYSIEARNAKAVEFYLHEIEEGLEEVADEIPEHEGFPIARLIETIAQPAVESMEEAAHTGDWPAIQQRYSALIYSCNRCHAATEHEFVVITPATGQPPFNQRFDLPDGLPHVPAAEATEYDTGR